MVTSESHPYARSGGLAEVCAALPRALAALGHDITVVMPRFRGIEPDATGRLPIRCELGPHTLDLVVSEHQGDAGVRYAFVDAPDLYDREGLYGDADGDYSDNGWRFAVLARAALEYIRVRGRRPAVIHVHDWQAGLVPVYQKTLLANDPVVGGVPVLCTIHNLAFQGLFPASLAAEAGLPEQVVQEDGVEAWGRVGFLKGAITFSERVSTVSPTYAREILTPEFGFGLEKVLARRSRDLFGILNGIDTARWSPNTDRFLPVRFGPETIDRKAEVRRALLGRVGLDDGAGERPVVGLLSRMTDQKGFDLIEAATPDLMALDATWVLHGSGDSRHEGHWRELAARYPGRVAAVIGFDEPLAHLVTAGSDLFLMPSHFEPCGLNQMHCLRYGTVPVVRATGGLADTVRDAERPDGNGFVFRDFTPDALVGAMRRALAATARLDAWRGLQRTGMAEDHSWDASAREYVKVYGTPRD
jgi:starch synthase